MRASAASASRSHNRVGLPRDPNDAHARAAHAFLTRSARPPDNCAVPRKPAPVHPDPLSAILDRLNTQVIHPAWLLDTMLASDEDITSFLDVLARIASDIAQAGCEISDELIAIQSAKGRRCAAV